MLHTYVKSGIFLEKILAHSVNSAFQNRYCCFRDRQKMTTATVTGSLRKAVSSPNTNRDRSAMSYNRGSRVGFKIDPKSPLYFDIFVPYICSEWDIPEKVVVVRKLQEEYVPVHLRKKYYKMKPITTTVKLPGVDRERSYGSAPAITQSTTKSDDKPNEETTVSILAYYDDRAQLVHVCISKCKFNIRIRIIKAISYCLPFHNALTKLTISQGLTSQIVREISEQLPHSNLTEICFDDSDLQGANYHILLDHVSQLRYLSLCRCNIGDFIGIEIATRMELGGPAADSLQILDLTSNFITDLGAQSFGNMLKRNRQLVHLNLSSNQITDDGASYLLESLMRYPLTRNDIIAKKFRKMKYLEKRAQVYKKCSEEILKTQKSKLNEQPGSSTRLKRQNAAPTAKDSKTKNPKKLQVSENHTLEMAEQMTNEIIGKNFVDIFDNDNIAVDTDGTVSSIGNLKLCYLNLAYNNLGYKSVKNILDLLTYQFNQKKPINNTGLIKVVIEGNNMPVNCEEFEMIQIYLKKVVDYIVGSVEKKSFYARKSFK